MDNKDQNNDMIVKVTGLTYEPLSIQNVSELRVSHILERQKIYLYLQNSILIIHEVVSQAKQAIYMAWIPL